MHNHMGEIILPVEEQLVVCSQNRLRGFFGQDIAVPVPPGELFTDLAKIIRFGAKEAVPYYQSAYTFTEKTTLEGWKVKPRRWFWDQIRVGNIPSEAATLEEGWFIDLDPKGIPDGKNDYLGPIMRELRQTEQIQKMAELDRVSRLVLMKEMGKAGIIYRFPGDGVVPETSRCGVSTAEIEGIILPCFSQVLQITGTVRNRSFMEFNVRGNMVPEMSSSRSLYFRDKFSVRDKKGDIIDYLNLLGGNQYDGGLSFVGRPWAERSNRTSFSLIIAYPSP